MAQLDWGETKSIMLEVEQLFRRDDDIRDAVDILKMKKEINLYRNSSIRDAKDVIKG